MSNKKLMKKVLIFSLSVTMVCGLGSSVYANSQALPNGTITTQNGRKFLTDSKGEKYSGWFIDSKKDWYYFNESDKTMKTGWHHDEKDGYWYYLNLSDGKMVTGWKTIEGKDYFFQPVRDMGNYHFNNEQEKWLYSVNSKVPYGAMYVNTITPDGSKVDSTGAKAVVETSTQAVNNSSSLNTDTVKNGWVSENGSWHYYESGILAKNKWLNLDGKWYYVLPDGAMVSNTWKEIAGKTYYFGSDGAMYVDTTTPDGSFVNADGIRVVNVADESIYLDEHIGTFYCDYGATGGGKPNEFYGIINIQSAFQNKIYGTMNLQFWEGDFEADFTNGALVSQNGRTVNITGVVNDTNGRNTETWEFSLPFMNEEAVIVNQGFIYKKVSTNEVKNGWVSENGSWHYYENGTLAKNKWLNLDGKWYYVLFDGAMVSNTWKEIGGKTYYFGSDGAMYVNTTTPDGNKVDENGVKVSQFYEENKYNDYVGNYINAEEISTWEIYKGYNFEISKIADGKIYGLFRQEAGAYSGYTADFTQGVSFDENGSFTIKTQYEDVHSDYDPVNGEYIESKEYGNIDCKLELKNGVPVIQTNSESFLDVNDMRYLKQ
ncbi:hypothetical protein [Hungatella hathewayi]|uniref:hypothetical protein n=1 Tax=Hungatella hathewayi TaxID=154046 RepID=UPI00356485C5